MVINIAVIVWDLIFFGSQEFLSIKFGRWEDGQIAQLATLPVKSDNPSSTLRIHMVEGETLRVIS